MSSSSSCDKKTCSIEDKIAILRKAKAKVELESLENFANYLTERIQKKHGEVLLEFSKKDKPPIYGLDLGTEKASNSQAKTLAIPKIRSWNSEKKIPRLPVSLSQFTDYWTKASPLRTAIMKEYDTEFSSVNVLGCMNDIMIAAKVDDADYLSITVDHFMEQLKNKSAEWLFHLLNCKDFDLHGISLIFNCVGDATLHPIVFHYRAMTLKNNFFDVFVYLKPSAFQQINTRIYQHLKNLC